MNTPASPTVETAWGTKYPVRLTASERRQIKSELGRGRCTARLFHRMQVLQLLDEGLTVSGVARVVGVSRMLVRRVAQRYCAAGLAEALVERPRPGRPRLLSAQKEEALLALARSNPPRGVKRWTLSLLAETAVRRRIAPHMCGVTVGNILAEHKLTLRPSAARPASSSRARAAP